MKNKAQKQIEFASSKIEKKLHNRIKIMAAKKQIGIAEMIEIILIEGINSIKSKK